MDESLQPGTHLSTPRRGYRHHGLYVGDGRVLHYGGLRRFGRRGPVEEVSLERFARGHGYAVQPAHAAPRFCGEQAIERARSRLGEDRYRLLTNNCEHFVTWCLDGRGRSAQVEAWQQRWQRLSGAFGRPLRAARALAFGLPPDTRNAAA